MSTYSLSHAYHEVKNNDVICKMLFWRYSWYVQSSHIVVLEVGHEVQHYIGGLRQQGVLKRWRVVLHGCKSCDAINFDEDSLWQLTVGLLCIWILGSWIVELSHYYIYSISIGSKRWFSHVGQQDRLWASIKWIFAHAAGPTACNKLFTQAAM